MSLRQRLVRLIAGLLAIVFTLAVVFSILLPMANRWGATPAEIAATLPGDELLDRPLVNWTNAITIQVPPEAVWPWIIQIGERRGGYYSYTWIENTLFGKGSYVNASRAVPDFQNPPQGQVLIGEMLMIREYQPDRYMLAESMVPDLGWTWSWNVFPAGNGQTRLVIRNRVQPFTEAGNPAMIFFMDVGGFAMEQRMMQGIKLRAEGFSEPPYRESLEYFLFLGALLAGLASGLVFLSRSNWLKPLLAGIASVVALPVFLIVQPPLWIRGAIILILIGGLAWATLDESQFARPKRRELSKPSVESA
jgi:hypothetical protein